jgi:hypothetical protein
MNHRFACRLVIANRIRIPFEKTAQRFGGELFLIENSTGHTYILSV